MGNLLTSLLNSTNALQVYSRGLQVVENDVTNASTPGYVKQTQSFQALPFDIAGGAPGGVAAGPVQSSRDLYAEQNVRSAQSALGFAQRQSADLSQLSNLFDISGKSGIGPALNGLFNSFSQLSVNPNDATLRQTVLNEAGSLAQTIQQTAQGLSTASQQSGGDLRSEIDDVNTLANTIARINGQGVRDSQGNTDSGLDAQLNAALEQLSQYANYTALQKPDGTITVYLGGQTPLVSGDQAFAIQGDFSSPQAAILDSTGKDITGQITQGQLAGSLDIYNNKLPAYVSGLNTLAQGVADQVNATLAGGIDQNGASPVQDLFTYDATAPARTLAVNGSVTPDQIAAALPGAAGGNGNALVLASLGRAQVLNGATFAGYYGVLGSRIGTDIANAAGAQDTQTQVLTQAQSLRSNLSAVSLDEEAARLIQFQSAYQAVSKMVTILDSLTGTVINMISTN